MADKTIYVREEDEALWEWLVSYTKARRMPVSSQIMNLVQRFREEVERGDE